MSATKPVFKFDQESCSTQNIEQVHFRWTIENFSELDSATGTAVRSSDFNSNEHKWYLNVYPNGRSDIANDYISLFLNLATPGPSTNNADLKLKTKFRFFLLNTADKPLVTTIEKTQIFEEAHPSWGYQTFVKRSDLLDRSKGYLIEDKLKVGAEITIIKDVTTSGHGICGSGKKGKLPSEPVSYLDFMNNPAFSDVKIINSVGEELPAHKVFLAKHSSVFAKMLEIDMVEKKENCIRIPNLSPPTLIELLKYIYSGKVENIDDVELIKNLLSAADEFFIFPLKQICEDMLIKKMPSQNPIMSLQFADAHNCAELKECAIRWIELSKDTVLTSQQWKELLYQNPDLANEVMLKLAKVNVKRKADEMNN